MIASPTHLLTATSVALVTLALSSGCGGRQRTSAATPYVQDVSIAGNSAISDDAIIARLAHRPPGFLGRKKTRLDRSELRLDGQRIARIYAEDGFFRTQVLETDVTPGKRKDRVKIRFVVKEGQPTHIEQVDVTGIPSELTEAANRILDDADVQIGKRLGHQRYLDARDQLKQMMQKRGYAHADLKGKIRVDRDTAQAQVVMTADPGPLVRFGRACVGVWVLDRCQHEGKTVIPNASIQARIPWQEGKRYDPELVDKATSNLRELSFASVRIDLDREDRPEVSRLAIHVNDGNLHEVKAGVGASKDGERVEGRVRAEYSKKRFFDPLLTFRANAQVGQVFLPDKRFLWQAQGSLTRQDLFVPLIFGSVTGGVSLDDYEAFNALDTGLSTVIGRPFLDRRLRITAGWDFHLININARDNVVDQSINSLDLLAYFTQAVALDLRDRPIAPTLGVFAELSLEEGGPFAGGEINYFRWFLDTRGYLPIGSRLVLAGRAQFGSITIASSEPQPFTRRFYGGGSSSHRGFTFRRLSPFVEAENMNSDGTISTSRLPIGGNTLFLATAELRITLADLGGNLLKTVLLTDVGDVTRTRDSLDFTNLHYAVGGGIRLHTSVGLIARIEAAYRLNRTEATPENPDPVSGFFDRLVFHISLGQSF